MAEDNRSRLQILREDVLRIRVKGKPSPQSQLPNTAGTPGDLVNVMQDITDKGIIGNLQDLQDFRQMSSDAETRYRIFDEMETDSVISSALDMYADDATQYNNDGKVIWAESENSDVAKFANRLIDIFQLNNKAWEHIRSLIKYGDLYLELFRDDESSDDSDPYNLDEKDFENGIKMYIPKRGSELEEYIEKVENPAVVYELSRKGKTVGYVKTKENDTNSLEPTYKAYQSIQVSDEDILMPSDKYVHIYLAGNERFSQTISMQIQTDDGLKCVNYKVLRGKSILHDLYKIYKELQLMEDALLLNRVTRSSIIRILQIEMGDMPKSQARETLKRFKQLIEQKNFMDKTDGTYSSQASPGPIDNCIYVPTYNGKGAISSSNLGGDVDVKSIVDLDYFREKLAGGLKIPLSYISGTAQENGLGGGSSLAKMDARYARTVKRIQNAYIQGITNLINIFAVNKHLDTHINNFTIKMVSPATQEDMDRTEDMSIKVDLVSSITDFISGSLQEIEEDKMRAIVEYLVSNYLNEPEISDVLKEIDKEAEEAELEEEENNSIDMSAEDDFDNDFGGPRGGGGSRSFGGGADMDFGDIGNDLDTGDLEGLSTEGGAEETGGGMDFGPEEFGDFESDYA